MISRYLTLILIVTQLSANFAQTQNITDKSIYKCTYQVNKPKGYHQAKSEKFILYVGNSYTLFLGETKMKYDSALKKTDDAQVLMGQTPLGINAGSLSKERILASRKNNTLTIIDSPIRKPMHYFEKISHKWKLVNEYKQINGWECQKAEVGFGGRNYEAWFTRTVALPVGPYKFFGLPGLIVKVQDTDCLFNFELINLSKSNIGKEIQFDTSGTLKSTKEKIQTAYENLAKNPAFALQSESTYELPESMLKNMKPKDPPVFIEIIQK